LGCGKLCPEHDKASENGTILTACNLDYMVTFLFNNNELGGESATLSFNKI